MKKILIIAGPNGAGKTTFAEEFLPNEADCPEFVNADLIAAGSSSGSDLADMTSLMEDPAKSSSARIARVLARTSGDPDFIGAEVALKRASTKAMDRGPPRRAGTGHPDPHRRDHRCRSPGRAHAIRKTSSSTKPSPSRQLRLVTSPQSKIQNQQSSIVNLSLFHRCIPSL
jgi:hypothetical protein